MSMKSLLWLPALVVYFSSVACVPPPQVRGAQHLSNNQEFWVYIETDKADVDGVWYCRVYPGDDTLKPVCIRADLRDE